MLLNNKSSVGTMLGLAGTLEFKNNDGSVLKTVEFAGQERPDDTALPTT